MDPSTEIFYLKQEIQQRDYYINCIQSQHVECYNKLIKVEKRSELYYKKYVSLSRDVYYLNSYIDHLTSEKDEFKSINIKLYENIKKETDYIQQIQQEYQETTASIKKLQKQLEKENDSLKKQLEEAKNEKHKCETTQVIPNLSLELNQLQNENNKIRAQIKEIKLENSLLKETLLTMEYTGPLTRSKKKIKILEE